MSDDLKAKVEAIRARHAAATLGPWIADGCDIYAPSELIAYGDGARPAVATTWPAWNVSDRSLRLRSGSESGNARFIAAAWQDVADLLARIAELEAREGTAP